MAEQRYELRRLGKRRGGWITTSKRVGAGSYGAMSSERDILRRCRKASDLILQRYSARAV
jgi:hypothetical protein